MPSLVAQAPCGDQAAPSDQIKWSQHQTNMVEHLLAPNSADSDSPEILVKQEKILLCTVLKLHALFGRRCHCTSIQDGKQVSSAAQLREKMNLNYNLRFLHVSVSVSKFGIVSKKLRRYQNNKLTTEHLNLFLNPEESRNRRFNKAFFF